MKKFLSSAAVLFALTASASFAGPKDIEAESLIARAVADQIVLMSCGAPTPQDLDTMQMAWTLKQQRQVRSALAALDVDMEALMRIMAKTSLDNLMAKTTGPKKELAAFCDENAAVLNKVTAPDYADPTAELEKLLK
jgi:hypothetical protein